MKHSIALNSGTMTMFITSYVTSLATVFRNNKDDF